MAEGPVIGDGGFVFALEKRGYVKAGPWTPEAAIEHPDAGKYNVFITYYANYDYFRKMSFLAEYNVIFLQF